MDKKLELLRAVPLFAGIGGSDLTELGRLADEVDLPAGRVLMRQGETAEEFFVIVDGTVAIERDGAALGALGPGDFLGEIALVDGGPRTATATAETDLRVLVVGHREFHSLLNEFNDIRAAVLRALAERIRRTDPEAT